MRRTQALRRVVTMLRLIHASAFLVAFTLLGMAAVSLFSWRQIARASEARSRAADEAITEYASYAARMFAEGSYRMFESVRLRTLLPIFGTRAAANAPTPSLKEFSNAARAELERIAITPVDAELGFFVLNPTSGFYQGTGTAAAPQMAKLFKDALERAPRPVAPGMPTMQWINLTEPPLIAGFIRHGSNPAHQTLYGFAFAPQEWWQAIGDAVVRQLPLLPASFVDPSWRYLVDPQRIDTLVAITLYDAQGKIGYQSRPPFPSGLTGEFNALNGPAAFRVVATLHPAMDSLLRKEIRQSNNAEHVLTVRGGDGMSPFQVRIGMLLPPLSLLFVLVAAALVWRQRTMARARRTFVGTVSHELRTPLAQIRLYTETLQLGREEGTVERRRWLDIISRETRRLANIVDNILLFSHLDAGRARLEPEPTDLGELIEEVVESFVPLAQSRDMRLIADAPSRIIAAVDPRAMRQVVANLLDNALKYGPAGQTVTVELERVGDVARLVICDDGPGIPAGRQRHIWKAFGTVRIGDGTGIGLAVVRGLVAQHGGRISVTRPPGRGACFIVELNVMQPTEGPIAERRKEHSRDTLSRRTNRHAVSRWRDADAGTVALVLALGGVTLLSLTAAQHLRHAWLAHQEATDRAIREYASFAARLYYDRSYGVFERLRLQTLATARARVPNGAPEYPLSMIARTAADALEQMQLPATGRDIGFFRLDRRTGAYEGTSLANEPSIVAEIRRGIDETESLASPPEEPVRWIALVDRPEHLSVGYVIQRDYAGTERSVYGLVLPRLRVWDAVGRTVLRELLLLPPSLTDPQWRWLIDPVASDSLVAVTMQDTKGRLVFRSRAPFAGSPVGEFDSRNTIGGVLITATLHPDLVRRLRERFNATQHAVMYLQLPMLPGVLRVDILIAVLSLVLVAAVVLHLRHEHSLARARRDFIASVSHELRTPLAQMRMFTETLLLGRERDADERSRWLNIVSREARRLGDLVENILLFSHLGADVSKLEKERTDLGELVEEIVEGYIPAALQRDVRLLADAPSRIFVLVDPRAMRQVIVNLLDNAIKYGPKGQTVSIDLEQVGGIARLSVTDQGPGIPVDLRKRIWEPFVRLGRYAGTTAGSGIGLSVVRGLVERHGGTITVDDAPGGGARFVVELEISESAEGLPLRATGEWSTRTGSRPRPASIDQAGSAGAADGR